MTPPPRRRWFGTLKARLMLASMLVIALSVTVSTLVVLDRLQGRSEQALMDLERDNAERAASLLAQRVVGLQNMLRVTARSMPLAARREGAAAIEFLDRSQALTVAFATLVVATPDGRVLAIHRGDRAEDADINISDRDYFRQTVSSGIPVVSEPTLGRVSKEPVIQLAMPVTGEGGRVEAVLSGSLKLSSRNLFDDLTFAAGRSDPNAAVTIVTDARGVIISHPRHERVMRSIDTEPGLGDSVARWVAQGRPVEPSGFVAHEAGHFVSLAGVVGADWMVFRVTPDAELLGGLAQARRESLAWAAGVALLGGLFIFGLLALLLGPLSRLRERAARLQEAGLAVDAGWPQAQGEIGELSRVLQQVLQERAAAEKVQRVLAQQMGSLLAAAPIGIGFTRERRFELAGAEFCALLGWTEAELPGQSAHEIFSSVNDYEALGRHVREAFEAGRPYVGEWLFRRRDGSTFWGCLQGRPVAAGDPAAGTIWMLEDVTERRQARERLSWSASHDPLTRLLNRGAFEERLLGWLAAPAAGVPAALLFIDLDRFKQVNDSAGHAGGDAVLRAVAAQLQAQVRARDAVARLGGDEFALLLPGCVAAVAVQLSERLHAALLAMEVPHGGQRLRVGASVGVVEIDSAAGHDAGTWLARADAACYEAKRAGGGVARVAAVPPASAVALALAFNA